MNAALPARRVPAGFGGGLLVVLTAWAFLPQENLPSFDSLKLLVLVLGAAVLAIAAAARRSGDAREPLRDPLMLLPAGLALAAGIGALVAFPRGSLTGPVTALACVAVARSLPRGERASSGLTTTFRAAAIAAAGVGLYGILQKLGLDFAPWAGRREAVSTLGNTSFAAEFQAAALPLSIGLVLRPGEARGDRVLGLVGAALAVIHLALAQSRIDLVAAAAAGVVLVACVLANRRAARGLVVGSAVAALGLAVAFLLAGRYGAASVLGRGDTIAVRLHVWSGALDAFLARPFRMGGDPFIDVFPPFRHPEEYAISLGRQVDTPHMDLLEIAVTTGIAGLAVALVTLVLLARRLATVHAVSARDAAPLAACAAALLVSGLASSPLTHPATALLAAIVVGHVVALAPRPLALPDVAPRRISAGAAVLLAAALYPGPGGRSFFSDTYYAKAATERALTRTDFALGWFGSSIDADPWAATPRDELGRFLHELGQDDGAVQAHTLALAIEPNVPEIRVNLVNALRGAARGDEADALLAESLAVWPWHPLLLSVRASAAASRGDADGALRDLDAAVRYGGHDLQVRRLRLEVLLTRHPGEATRAEALDLLDAFQGDVPGRARAARAFAKRDPGFLGALLARARSRLPTGREEAMKLAVSPIDPKDARLPDDADYYVDAALLATEAGLPELAGRLTARALAARARRKLASGDGEAALRLIVLASEKDPRSEYYVTEVLCQAHLRNREATRDALATAIAAGRVDTELLRKDPAFARLLPDAALDSLLSQAEGQGAHR